VLKLLFFHWVFFKTEIQIFFNKLFFFPCCDIVLFPDDTSGNRSKRWNCHESWSWVAGGLSFQETSQQSNVHFICTSNICSGMEMAGGLVEDLLSVHDKGIRCIHGVTKNTVIAIPRILNILADNPMHNKITSHMTGNCTQCCRKCMIAKNWKTWKEMYDYITPNGAPLHDWQKT
jgi:hypothetical protein